MFKKLCCIRSLLTVSVLIQILVLAGCSRPDHLVLHNGYAEEIKVKKVAIDSVPTPDNTGFSIVPGQSVLLPGNTNSKSPLVTIEWSYKGVDRNGGCSYQRPHDRCEIDIAISERGLSCGSCGRALGF